MQQFVCQFCSAQIFFDNYQCTQCGHPLAYLPDRRRMSALEEVEPGLFSAPQRSEQRYRRCQNHADYAACNWAVPEDDPEPLCRACRLNEVIPDLSVPEHRDAWLHLEAAKRRLLVSLFALGLRVVSRKEDPSRGLSFSFLASSEKQPVFTGHSDGLITINVAEADDPFREKMREQLGETYRTLLGHFRHEIGHYYWDCLIRDSEWQARFRELFGDERVDYAQALKRHYEKDVETPWSDTFVSRYASMHPWEDWAETFAHYLHMFETLDTARAYGLRVMLGMADDGRPAQVTDAKHANTNDFERMVADWIPLTVGLNSLNRSMGQPDLYPFVLSSAVLDKLRFVHEVIGRSAQAREVSEGARPAKSASLRASSGPQSSWMK